LGRSGFNCYHDQFGFKADLLCLGGEISNGTYPVSCVLGSKEVMNVLSPGTHGSTYGGNPLASKIVQSVIREYINSTKISL
jgi:ornithine--oxo-acid transaminase